ncbi:SDR family oxidoreductase [Pseudoalteromonas sp. McH1-7]|uniref:SDR family NAD(P)-dependent oxidoreductase n=1 Tax=Pseudoalteromonas sp. McH1-7 TaxID=2745574 RepID=UPI00158FE6AA|nr:SDR family oxidoreductase [Pseudoalteromonas sp. McH1-7]NUZ12512.1 SDR family oxidoreductase [Pseudoalteromonas sp. McH1-7]
MSNSNIALITGASGGIGMELAKVHAAKGNDVVIVARSEHKLLALKQELESTYNVKVWVLAEDLSHADSAQRIYEKTKSLGIEVGILINNAGFGGHGLFHQRALEQDQAMMQVNMVTLTNLTHYFLQDMIKANYGRILNVSSTASFMPGPLQAVYYATKAYVTSFTQAIAEEVSDYNITTTALCPGTVATGFVAAGDLDGLSAWDKAKSPKSVAEIGYRDMEKGKLVSFNETGLKFMLNWIIPLLPRKTVLKMSRQFMEK